MRQPPVRTLCVAALAATVLVPSFISRIVAPANYGAHGLTTGFGRGRLDLPGIVSEGSGSTIDLPPEPAVLTLRLRCADEVHVAAAGVTKTRAGSDTPGRIRLELPAGGPVHIESASRIRLLDLVIERVAAPWIEIMLIAIAGVIAIAGSWSGVRQAVTAAVGLLIAFASITHGRLTSAMTHAAMAQLVPGLTLLILLWPLMLALRIARAPSPLKTSVLTRLAFVLSLALVASEMFLFDPPRVLGDPRAYFEMGGRFANALAQLGSPLALGPILSDVRTYLALPATGMLYGILRFLSEGTTLIYTVQALAMAGAVAAMVAICEKEFGARVAKVALVLACLHPTFWALPAIVQPEPFILLAWTTAAALALSGMRENKAPGTFVAVGLLFGGGLALHPQGLSFLLVAFALCLALWAGDLARHPARVAGVVLGMASVLMPVAAAARFSRPLAYVLDKQYGFFAYTSPHPLGFWLYVDSDGWQGPLRIEDTTYQKELIAERGESAVSSSFADVARFVATHAGVSTRTLLTNLHRLWHQPDNPFAIPFPLPFPLQPPLQRSLVVLFVLSLGSLLGTRRAILALPFVMLSMTYPAYHVFNKYATPALPFSIIGSAFMIDRLWRRGTARRGVIAGLMFAAFAVLIPTGWAARLQVRGDLFLISVWGLLWLGLVVALVGAVRVSEANLRAKILASAVGVFVLLLSSFAAARSDTNRGAWSSSLREPFEATCRVPLEARPGGDAVPPGDPVEAVPPAWLMVDVESKSGEAPQIEVDGRPLAPATPTMPAFGLATLRGHRRPEEFRQMWRAPLDEETLGRGHLTVRVKGDAFMRLFGDIRGGSEGPRLGVGAWPYLSVYRLMHEGQYRLPAADAPPQACDAAELSGRPGIAMVRIRPGEEAKIAQKMMPPPRWVF